MSDDIETLRKALVTCADSLEGELKARYGDPVHPALLPKWNSDMQDVYEARDALAALDRLGFNFKSQSNETEIVDETIDRLKAERNSLRKALDDRFAADQRAAKAIFAETGRTSGFPSVKEVVAWYVAEVDRLEKELHEVKMAEHQTFMDAATINVENWSLRVKLERAKEAMEAIRKNNWTEKPGLTSECGSSWTQGRWSKIAEAVLSELSDDAPAQQNDEAAREAAMQKLATEAQAIGGYDAPAQQTKISDEASDG